MNPQRGALVRRCALGLAVGAALPVLRGLEDAYALPQTLALGFAALLLALSFPTRRPVGPLFGSVLIFFSWRLLCRVVAAPPGSDLDWCAAAGVGVALFFFAAASLLETAPRRFLAAAMLASGAAVSAVALLEWTGHGPFGVGAVDMGFAGRAHGTLGNPDFLGGWLAMLLPAGVAFAFAAEARAAEGLPSARPYVYGAVVLMTAALAATEARAAWLAGAAGVGVAWRHGRRDLAAGGRGVNIPRALKSAAWVLALTAVAFAAWRGALPARMREAFDFRSEAWRSRIFLSACALDLAKEHPWVGVGPGGFTDGFLRKQGERLTAGSSEPWRYTHDAHNDWLQTAAETGWPGFLLWVGIWIQALRLAWRRKGPGGAALAGGLVALAVQGLFHFPLSIPASAGLVWLGLAQAAAWEAEARGSTAPLQRWHAGLAALLLLGASALLLRQAAASALLNAGNSLERRPGALALARPHWAAAARLTPQDARPWLRLGRAELERGAAHDAVDAWQRALAAHPELPEAWINLGLALAQAGSLETAVQALRQGAALNPRSAEAWSNLGKAAWLLGRRDEAEALLRRGLTLAGPNVQGAFNLGALLYNERRFKEAAEAFRLVLRLQPDHAEAASLLKDCEHAR